jgi:hypothetical protein
MCEISPKDVEIRYLRAFDRNNRGPRGPRQAPQVPVLGPLGQAQFVCAVPIPLSFLLSGTLRMRHRFSWPLQTAE